MMLTIISELDQREEGIILINIIPLKMLGKNKKFLENAKF